MDYTTLLERIATALEQIALEMASPTPATAPAAPVPQLFPQPQATQPTPVPSFPAIGWLCPIHGGSKVVPAGVSGKTGKPYTAFLACAERGCDQKPPRVAQQLP